MTLLWGLGQTHALFRSICPPATGCAREPAKSQVPTSHSLSSHLFQICYGSMATSTNAIGKAYACSTVVLALRKGCFWWYVGGAICVQHGGHSQIGFSTLFPIQAALINELLASIKTPMLINLAYAFARGDVAYVNASLISQNSASERHVYCV